MSTMHTDVDASMVDLWAFGADAGTLTQPDGDPIPCQIQIDFGTVVEPDGSERLVTGRQIRAKVLKSEIGDGVRPRARRPGNAGGIFLLCEGPNSGVSFEVTEIVDEDNHFITCAVKVKVV